MGAATTGLGAGGAEDGGRGLSTGSVEGSAMGSGQLWVEGVEVLGRPVSRRSRLWRWRGGEMGLGLIEAVRKGIDLVSGRGIEW
ncbi:hypothetical protein M0R45_035734 [Rubus argutus]|uniref:Uncharacterized protein n=1 Tax=Rubus argutus TaxID=59490 RepID=A0AAW1VU11_RUBAR